MLPHFQVASDVIRDGLGLELVADDNRVLAEVFRHDASHRLTVTCYEADIEFALLEALIGRAREELGAFEDGSPLPQPRGRSSQDGSGAL